MKDRIKSLITDQKRVLDIAMLFCIAVFAFFINRDIEIKGLYMDDLYMWSCYGEQNFFEFVFPIGTSSRFRPVYWLFTYIQMVVHAIMAISRGNTLSRPIRQLGRC